MRLAFLLIPSLAIAGQFTTSLGDQYPYTISSIATDAAGNTYVVGSRQIGSTAFSGIVIGDFTAISSVEYLVAQTDVFVSKVDPSGKVLFTDHFGGNGSSTGSTIALDPSGNIYIGGNTTANDFPLSAALQTQPANGQTGFVMKLSNDGMTILYSTYFGGTLGSSAIAALATDSKGNLYVTGSTEASDFPITPGLPAGPAAVKSFNSITGAIVAEISAAGDKIIYSGVISGTEELNTCSSGSCLLTLLPTTSGTAIALDARGNVYIGGNTNTTNLPTTGNVFSAKGYGAFVAKVNAGGLGYLSYIDSTETSLLPDLLPSTNLNGIAVDASGDVYLAGSTNDPNFPTTQGSFQPTFAGGPIAEPYVPADAFIAKLNSSGSALVWSTFLSGGQVDGATAMALDATGNVWISGVTNVASFPNANGWISGGDFLAALNSTGTQLQYSARYPSGTAGKSIAFDAAGFLHFAGSNGFVSAINPSAAPSMEIFALQNGFGGAATARIAASEVISIFGPGIGPTNPITASPTNGFYPATLGGVTVTIGGYKMPLLYVSANQINAVVPTEIYSSTATSGAIILTNEMAVSPAFPVVIVPSAPQAFPTVLNQDGTINSQSNPAKGGSIVTFYATGWVPSVGPDGEVISRAANLCVGFCTVTPGNSADLILQYGGPAPDIVEGVSQFNIQIDVGSFAYPPMAFQLSITIGSSDRPEVTPSYVMQSVWVHP